MLDKQSKNITKAVLTVLLLVILGEGVFGLGFYWPFLLILLDWRGIFWYSILIGIIISGLHRISVGLPSLFLIVVTGGLSLFFGSRKETGWVLLIFSLLSNFVFDKVFGFEWSIGEAFSVLAGWVIAVRWFEKSETIKINY